MKKHPVSKDKNKEYRRATFAGGCFWCMQPPFDKLRGVIETHVGYTGGHIANPTYEDVCTERTGHAEAIEITFDPEVLTYRELLDVFWRNIDPVTTNRQFSDSGTQYRTAIFYHDDEQRQIAEASKYLLQISGRYDMPIVTQIVPAAPFYLAEASHQKYYRKHPVRYKMYNVASGRNAYVKGNQNMARV